MKQSHRFRTLRNAAEVVRTSPTPAIAAKRLGVDVSTIYRWIKAGRVAPAVPVRERLVVSHVEVPVSIAPDDWAAQMRADGRDLTASQQQLIDGGTVALGMMRDATLPASARLTAIRTFQAVVRDLEFGGDAVTVQARPAVFRRTGTDPRAVLMAIK